MYRGISCCFSLIGWIVLMGVDLVLFASSHPVWGMVVLIMLFSTPLSRFFGWLSEKAA